MILNGFLSYQSFLKHCIVFFNPHRLTLTLFDANDPLGLMRR